MSETDRMKMLVPEENDDQYYDGMVSWAGQIDSLFYALFESRDMVVQSSGDFAVVDTGTALTINWDAVIDFVGYRSGYKVSLGIPAAAITLPDGYVAYFLTTRDPTSDVAVPATSLVVAPTLPTTLGGHSTAQVLCWRKGDDVFLVNGKMLRAHEKLIGLRDVTGQVLLATVNAVSMSNVDVDSAIGFNVGGIYRVEVASGPASFKLSIWEDTARTTTIWSTGSGAPGVIMVNSMYLDEDGGEELHWRVQNATGSDADFSMKVFWRR